MPDSFRPFGLSVDVHTLNIILPVGISFYTFQTLSYTIDIYRDRIKPESDVIAFFSFVATGAGKCFGALSQNAHCGQPGPVCRQVYRIPESSAGWELLFAT